MGEEEWVGPELRELSLGLPGEEVLVTKNGVEGGNAIEQGLTARRFRPGALTNVRMRMRMRMDHERLASGRTAWAPS